MQQSGPQFMPSRGYGPGAQAAAPGGLAQPQPFSHVPPISFAPPPPQSFAQPQPQQPMPFAQSYAQPIPGQPFPQPYAQPGAPAQPYGQPYPQGQSAGQPVPIAPVPAPGYAQPVTQSQPANQQQSAQQQYTRQAVGVARNLEQIIPGYQLAISLLSDIIASPKGQPLAGAQPLLDTLKDATFYHFATLGAIRRFLCGETTPDVIGALAVAINQLNKIHSLIRPQTERLLVGAPPELRGAISNISQTVGAVDSQLQQALSAVQANVSAQIWEAARAKIFAAAEEVKAEV